MICLERARGRKSSRQLQPQMPGCQWGPSTLGRRTFESASEAVELRQCEWCEKRRRDAVHEAAGRGMGNAPQGIHHRNRHRRAGVWPARGAPRGLGSTAVETAGLLRWNVVCELYAIRRLNVSTSRGRVAQVARPIPRLSFSARDEARASRTVALRKSIAASSDTYVTEAGLQSKQSKT